MSRSADGGETSSMVELTEWEKINPMLKRHGCAAVHVSGDPLSGAVLLVPQASLALRTAIKSLVEDTERRQNLIHGLIQSNNQLKHDARVQQDRAGRQEQRADELQRILDSVKSKVRDLEDDFIRRMRQQQQEAAGERCQKHEEKLRDQEQSIARLRKRLSQAAAAEEKRRRSFLQQNSHLDLQRYELSVEPVLERNGSEGSLDLDTTPNYKALIKSYQEQIQEAQRKEERLLQENGRLREEMEARPSVKEFRVHKQQMKKMEKIFLQNSLSATRESKDEAEPHRERREHLPDGECQRHLQILSDISAVLSGPRAPPLLYKPGSRNQENHGPETRDETDFLHLLPTIELWAGQLQSLQVLHRSLRKLRHKLQPTPQDHRTEEAAAAGGVRVEDLLLLVDTMLEDVENQRQLDAERGIQTLGPKSGGLCSLTLYSGVEPSEGNCALSDYPHGSSPHVLQALVSHFQKLFDVPSVSGIYPRMNDVYSKLGEMSNAMKTLRCLLGLDDAASAGTVVNAVGRLCREEDGGRRLQQILGTLDMDSIINKVQEHEEFFPAFEELIKELLDVLGISHLEEILPEVQRLKGLEAR